MLLSGLALLVGAGCKRVPRCASCGMALDPASRWFAEVEHGGKTQGFDTPKCALRFWLTQASGGRVFVRSYYGQVRTDGGQVVFLVGSDVLGPMGADLVPVEPEHESKFKTEHKAQASYRLASLTLAIVEAQ